jgi:hypothetical protein
VLDSRCINHMTGERRIFTSFEKNEYESYCITFDDNSKAKFLGLVKLLSQLNILFLKFFLLNCWTIIGYPFHGFVRWVTIIFSPIRCDHL